MYTTVHLWCTIYVHYCALMVYYICTLLYTNGVLYMYTMHYNIENNYMLMDGLVTAYGKVYNIVHSTVLLYCLLCTVYTVLGTGLYCASCTLLYFDVMCMCNIQLHLTTL